jgi:hypothetical protein
MFDPIVVLRRCMQDAEVAARAALAANNMAEHMEQGAQYHTFAEAILKATGTDPRPKE